MDNTLSNDEQAELARRLTEEDVARLLLDRVGLERGRQPPWRTPQTFWHAVARELRAGAVADGRRKLLAVAAEHYPYNEVFAAVEPAVATKPADADAEVEVEADKPEWDFFVSYAPEDEDWAEWIVGILEDADYKVHASYVYDVGGAAEHVVVEAGMRAAERTIAVLTPAYLSSPYAGSQWRHVWRRDPQGVERKLVPVRVEECDPDGFLEDITLIDLVGRDRSAAARHLVDEVWASLHGRRPRAPGRPPFPGDQPKR